ncbi:MAG TPA: hypothetical protein VKZ78_07140 [Sphingobacteriaceae bacterium]|nr:hypothetical protein [Sphingobacteriaceae bacterium]
MKINKGLPPFIRTWKRFYWLVVIVLVVLILLFYWFTVHFG